MSRTKEAVYRQSGEVDYDEAGSPTKSDPEEDGTRQTATEVTSSVVVPLTSRHRR